MTILGLRATARKLGISHPALLKAVKSGRVKRLESGDFELESVTAALNQNSHPLKSKWARTQRKQSPVAQPAAEELQTPAMTARPSEADPGGGIAALIPPPADRLAQFADPEIVEPDEVDVRGEDVQIGLELLPAAESVSEATRLLEWERLRAIRLKTDREQGRLVDVTAVNAFVAGMILLARDKFTRLPNELRDELAYQTDPLRCEAILAARIGSILGEMSEYRRAA